jgi:protein O-mannosyl-transferase
MKIAPPATAIANPFTSSHPARWVALGLALVTMLLYLPAGWHGFILEDDPEYVTENAMVNSGLSWAGVKWAFFGWHASNWHPLTWLSHQLDCQLFGLNAGAHHLVSVLFHAANAVLLFLVWRRLTGTLWPAAVVAALFAWHPLHVESVAWVAERKDVLSTFFGLLALLAYARYVAEAQVRPPRAKNYFGWSLAAFALGLLAKPMLVTLPFVLLLLDYWPLRRFTDPWRERVAVARLILEKWPFFLLTILSCVCTFLAQRSEAVISLQSESVALRVENSLVATATYVGQTLWPVNLGAFYPLPQHYAPARVVVSLAVLLGISLLVWWARRKDPCLLMGWLWFLGMLVPVIGLVQVGGQAHADRYTYLPAVGLFVAIVFGLTSLGRRWRLSARWNTCAAALVLAVCLVLTARQLSFWRDSQTLFEHTLAVTGQNIQAHMLLAYVYHEQGRLAEARNHYQVAMDGFAHIMVPVAGGGQRPMAAQLDFRFGLQSERKQEPEEAAYYFHEALRLDPNYAAAHDEFAKLLAGAGQFTTALTEYQAVARLEPTNALAHENLGNALAKVGRLDEALDEYQTAARLAPEEDQAVFLQGKIWLRRGQSVPAVGAFEKALQLAPDDPTNLVYLACVLATDPTASLRNGARAVTLAERANQLTGGHQASMLATLAMAYAEAGRFAEARQTVQTALDLAVTNRPEMVPSLQAQQESYAANQPWRTPANPPTAPAR